MELLKNFIDIFIHLDKHLNWVIQNYGLWTYLLLFVTIFCETGLVVMPLLPGDSLLFAAGAFAATTELNVGILFALLSLAGILGDTVNYWIGSIVGPKIFHQEKIKFLNKKHLETTHRFYEKYGAKTIVIARFVPIVRTFAPFVAGIGKMSYLKFFSYNVVGGLLWVSVCVFSGYFFGNLPFVKKNFTVVILGIIFVSILPAMIEFVRHKLNSAKTNPPDNDPTQTKPAQLEGN